MKNKRNIFLLFSLLVTVFSLHGMEQAGTNKRKRASSSSSSSYFVPSSSSASALAGGGSLAGAVEAGNQEVQSQSVVVRQRPLSIEEMCISSEDTVVIYHNPKNEETFWSMCPVRGCKGSVLTSKASRKRLKYNLRNHLTSQHKADVSRFSSPAYPRVQEVSYQLRALGGVKKKRYIRRKKAEGRSKRAVAALLSLSKGGKEEQE